MAPELSHDVNLTSCESAETGATVTLDAERFWLSLALLASCTGILLASHLSESALALCGPLLGMVVGWWLPRVTNGNGNGYASHAAAAQTAPQRDGKAV